ncbi:nucleoside hydrolase [Ruania alba]|uniref:Inosine-uridine nucleoside N-ribohydrolase n=1 Tax=Ruania alba TaxID=648782 RepID=A0A1H5N7C1_9MICO|nr:nucleoside hydrolase [Ruania alba]SEE97436.1 Inosine-uridine nucleoside N-ribohydrolase [Ruania alba]
MDLAVDVREGEAPHRDDAPSLYLESDFYMDVDDVAALAIALTLHTAGKIDLIGFGVNADNEWGARCAEVVTYPYDVDLPVGVRGGIMEEPDRRPYDHSRTLCESYSEVPRRHPSDGTAALRRALAAAAPGSVTVASVGFMDNLVGLLDSGPDEHSDLAGVDLIRRSVGRTVMMGGVFPSGREHNLAWRPALTRSVLERWPGPIELVGFEAADQVVIGRDLADDLGQESPVALAFRLFEEFAGRTGRPSWDPLTVYLAAFGECELVEWSEPGRLTLDDDGTNHFHPEPGGPHKYAIPRVGPEQLARELDGWLRRLPVVSSERADALRSMDGPTARWGALPASTRVPHAPRR